MKLATLLTFAAAAFAEPRVIRDIEYARAGEIPLRLDLYLPESTPGPHPVIVSIHGGGWHGGDKAQSPGLDFTKRGYAVASMNYRLIPQAVFPAQIQDCKAAVRWLRAHSGEYGLDPKRFAAWGASAGGHLAALLGTSGGDAGLEGAELGNATESSRVQAVIDFFGPIDVVAWYGNQKDAPLIGAPVAGNEARLAVADPRTYADSSDPPTLIAHGDADTVVVIEHSRKLLARLEAAGVPVRMRVVANVGHSVNALNLADEVHAFLETWMPRR